MTKPERIKPDIQFIEEIQSVGGQDIKKCYQCATCSVVCPLSPMDSSFPRKEMIWAQWGLKDKLLSDMDIWLCHKCGQCSDMCPRGANPGELMAALRNMTYQNLVGPKFLGRWMSAAKHLPKLIAIPAILYLVIWFITGSMHGTPFPTEHGKIEYGLVFPPLWTIDLVFVPLLFLVLYTFYKGIKNLYAEFDKQPRTFVVGYQKPSNFLVALWQVIKEEVLTHKKWKDCGEEEEDQIKFKGHLTLFYSFVVLAIVTGVLSASFWADMLFGILKIPYPMTFFNPLNLLANIGAIALVVGLVYLTKRRINDSGRDSSTFYDWYLLGVIWAVAITGILCEIFRFGDAVALTYITYYIHLITVFMLIVYLPWSKLGHLVYRIAALAYARKVGRISTEIETNQNKLYVL
ncbi:MAG: quinone-interacting membrane-bound oxidoreductase complex subunit QmoC [Thermodesulfobacteriota bacterium]